MEQALQAFPAFIESIDFAAGATFARGHYNYFAAIALVTIGFYTVTSRPNLIKKIIGLSIFQNGVFLFYISLGIIQDGRPPILAEGDVVYVNPLPHVLILTAIVVGRFNDGARPCPCDAHRRVLWLH